jgi:hypothetical protein
VFGQITIEPASLEVRIHLPSGMHATDLSDGMRVQDGVVTWRGSVEPRVDLDVSFAPSLPLRLWRDVTSVFD